MSRYCPRLHLVLIALGLLALTACTTVPETGRSQLLLLSPKEEMQLGISAFDELKKNTPISRDRAMNAMLQRVGRRVAAVAPLPNAQWEFVLFDKPDVPNAFCLPGGKVGIFTGILPITQDEAGLATVIGHEVAHAVARHGAERMSRGYLMQIGGAALGAATQGKSAESQRMINAAYGLGGNLAIMLPHSREQELEADHIGLLYMARAGYDPRAAVDFWRRFQAYNNKQGKSSIEFLSTHPLDDRRIAELQKQMPRAIQEYRKRR